MTKEIQGPEQQQLSGQVKLSPEDAIQKHVAQFWSERMSDIGDQVEWPKEEKTYLSTREVMDILKASDPKEQLKSSITAIKKAETIRGVKRAASKAYVKGAKGAPLQALVQELVRERKTELRSTRGGQEPRQEMSW